MMRLVLTALLLVIVLPLETPRVRLTADAGILGEANEHYAQRRFNRALSLYETALRQNPVWFRQNPVLLARMAYAYLHTGKAERAGKLFRRLQHQLSEIQDHLLYLQLQAHLKQMARPRISWIRQVEQTLAGTPLQYRVDSVLAAYYHQAGKRDSALIFFTKMVAEGKRGSAEELQRVILLADSAGQDSRAAKLAEVFLRRFPFADFAPVAAKYVRRQLNAQPNVARFQRLFRFYLKRKLLEEARALLRAYQTSLLSREMYARYFVQLTYARGQYAELLQWIKRHRSRYKEIRTLLTMDLHLARCYLRLGQTDRAIAAYLQFQKRYPKAKLAPEVLWKVATLYQHRNAYRAAKRVYRQLADRYPRSEFYPEAVLRIGLLDYQQRRFRPARQYWQQVVRRIRNADFAARLRYWIAKAYLAEGNLSRYWENLAAIADEPFRNYYTLKAYLIVRDNPLHDPGVDSLIWAIPVQKVSTLNQYFSHFRRFWLLHQILGEPYTKWEFRQLRKAPQNRWEYFYALGELAELVGWHHEAFEVYRAVFLSYFKDKHWTTWRFMLKKLYPFYFQSTVEAAARRWDLPPAVIWAVMKKESSFQADAVSYANAHGLMQLIPATARQVSEWLDMPFASVRQLYDPEVNILLGSYYLARLRSRFEDNWYSVFAAYNAGPHRVKRWRSQLPFNDDDLFMELIEFDQTRRYVRVVMRYYWTYALLIHPDQAPEEIIARQ